MISQQDNQGVSPVIGVILMVAITVIIAAVVANFVLNLGQSLEEEPTATVTFQQSVSDFGAQRYNVSVSVTNMGNTDYLVVGTVGTSGRSFHNGSMNALDAMGGVDGSGTQFGSYDDSDESEVTYSGVLPTNVQEAPNHAGQSESVPDATSGAVVVSAGDQVVVTGLNATEQVQVFGGISGREAQVDSITVEGTLG
jgi:flagellin-like protein